MKPIHPLLLAGACTLVSACTPELGATASLIDQTRILAVKSDRPDVLPPNDVTFSALVAGPEGTVAAPALDWAFCLTPKPLSENNSVALGCLQDGVKAFGRQGPTAFGTIPDDGCSRFGPLAPPPPPGEKDSGSLRPRDADLTGGYYQPVRVTLIAGAPNGGDVVAMAMQRIQCGLVNASIDVSAEFNDPEKGYKANRNPKIASVSGGLDAGSLLPLVPDGGQAGPGLLGVVLPGSRLILKAAWSKESSELFPVLNTSTQKLDRRGETMRVAFFGNAGSFEHDVVGRAESELWTGLEGDAANAIHLEEADFVDNAWVAPDVPGIYRIWVVLRDSRGGVDFAAFGVLVN